MIQQRQIWPRGSNPFPQLLGFALALSAFAAPAHAAENLIVLIDSGEVKGTTEAGAPSIDVFRGIPFAAPPVGDLRWRDRIRSALHAAAALLRHDVQIPRDERRLSLSECLDAGETAPAGSSQAACSGLHIWRRLHGRRQFGEAL